MNKRIVVAGFALGFVLSGCGGDNPETPEAHQPGQAVDDEDYRGPQQVVTGHDHDDAEYGTRDKKVADVTERYCSAKKPDGSCKTYSTRTKYKTVPERYEKDDEDWILVLQDGTPVDVDQETQARYPIGSMYP